VAQDDLFWLPHVDALLRSRKLALLHPLRTSSRLGLQPPSAAAKAQQAKPAKQPQGSPSRLAAEEAEAEQAARWKALAAALSGVRLLRVRRRSPHAAGVGSEHAGRACPAAASRARETHLKKHDISEAVLKGTRQGCVTAVVPLDGGSPAAVRVGRHHAAPVERG